MNGPGVLAVTVLVAVLTTGARSLVGATGTVLVVRRRLPDPSPSRRAARAGPRWSRLAAALDRADVDLTPPAAIRLVAAAATAGGAVGLLVGGPPLAVLTAVAVSGAAPLTLLGLDGRRQRHADEGLPTVLDDIARSLRSGESPPGALAAAAAGPGATAARHDVGVVVAELRSGVAMTVALERWASRRPSRSVRLVVAALAIGVATGGARSRAVESVGATLRERQAVDREAAVLATQARSSALVIALAPLAFAVLASVSDTRVSAFLLGSPLGLACLVLGLASDGLGAWWMHRIVHPRSDGGTTDRPVAPRVRPAGGSALRTRTEEQGS